MHLRFFPEIRLLGGAPRRRTPRGLAARVESVCPHANVAVMAPKGLGATALTISGTAGKPIYPRAAIAF